MLRKDTLISRLIVESFFKKLGEALVLDVAVAGAGPSALALGIELAKKGWKVALFEAKNEPGGGIWGGGMMFNELVVEAELEEYLKELDVRYRKVDDLIVIDSVHFASALLYHATKNGALLFNNVYVEDLVMYDGKVSGVVVNWTPTVRERLHVDPITIVAKYVVDATGHPANLVRFLVRRGVIKLENFRVDGGVKIAGEPGNEFLMDAENGERFVVEHTKEIYPGLYVMGMAAVSVGGGPRMGPIFGGMVLSGLKAAQLIHEKLILETSNRDETNEKVRV
ncbi:sulfide-dependent adenosine diphosphate thiazole synthase [Fervidobacterium thailandense]|uniref:Thiamine thiazole synthase n=1 Tax=Fervidobacterium thailandense TaxID=1008305 RepID=A0A1E3G2Q7_9BACT|nr:sulfide-dependent adenosine diphosphate thiazole synthase [Fervidobacterium thailandense]ODN30517.1 ribose 1,5-bisphosphate isomerase [Fervidobacterium thailandense]